MAPRFVWLSISNPPTIAHLYAEGAPSALCGRVQRNTRVEIADPGWKCPTCEANAIKQDPPEKPKAKRQTRKG